MDETVRYPTGVGRKPITNREGDKLKPYTVRLFERQIAWLAKQGNGSEYLRRMLDRAMKRK